MQFPDTILGVLFTRGISFSVWESSGIIEREVKVYQELSKEYKKILIFTYGTNESKKYSHFFSENVEIISRNKWIPKLLYFFLLPFLHKKKWRSVSVVKSNQMDGSLVGVFVKWLYSKKFLLRMGYEWLEYLEREKRPYIKRLVAFCAEYISYKSADAIMISSQSSKNFIRERFNVDERKITVIPNYVDVSHFSPTLATRKRNRLVFVGRLEKVKNLENLIDALVGLNLKLTVVGNGSLKEKLEQKAQKNNIDVAFLGIVSQKELPKTLNENSIFIIPSLSEGNPKALLEAMSCGLACVGSDVPGINSLIQDRFNGFLCGTDVKSIHDALLKLLSDSVLVETIGLNARRTICDNFSSEGVFQKEIRIHNLLHK